ncbi:MAG: histidine phosphatase family protein [Acidimicrobiia bacterium]
MRTLLLMRHGKSDWNADYDVDHDRPLNDRGVRSARVMGQVLTEEGETPDLIITSTAVRARTTAQLAAEAGGWGCEIVLEPRLYGSGADMVVQVAGAAPQVGRLMLVGHQPTWSIVVSVLTGDQVEMKTATVASLGFDVDDWAELASVRGTVDAVYQPRDYLDGE